MQKTNSLTIDWTSQKVLSQIAEKINKPLADIIRLTQYIQKKAVTEGTDYETERISSILLESSEQIETLIESIVAIEENNRIEVLIHDKFKYPALYTFEEVSLNASNNLMQQLAQESENRISKADLEWLIQIETTILDNIDFYGLNVSWLARNCATSERQIFRKIEKFTRLTPNKYIRCLKLYKAKGLLENYTYATVNEVAAAVGLKDPYYFSSIYKEEFGRKPKEYLV